MKHTYTLEGSKILRETWGTNELVTLFDNEENVCGLVYNDEPYYFMKNLQSDVIAITDRDGTVVARYSYDAWGVCTIEQDSAYCIGGINPYRYRGYYYDSEIGMYYLQSRYYDPEIGRWLNVDAPEILGILAFSNCVLGTNLYTYCLNNAVNDNDVAGGISAKQIAGMFSISAISALATPILFASYSKGLIAVGGYATKIVTPVAVKAFWWKPWMAAAIIIAAVAIIVAAVGIYFSKQAKKSAKERAKDAPSWLTTAMGSMPPHWGEKAKEYAKRLLDRKYGKGNWKATTNSEYSKIVKYLTRHVGMP